MLSLGEMNIWEHDGALKFEQGPVGEKAAVAVNQNMHALPRLPLVIEYKHGAAH